MRCLVWFFLLSLSTGIFGCSSGETDQQRLKRLVPNAVATTPVKGKVTINGEAVEGIWVRLRSASGEELPYNPETQTKADGSFVMTTYLDGDGAPKGEYVAIIEWLVFYGKEWRGPDGLQNKYNDPKTSEFKVTVGDSSVSLPAFELTSDKSVEEIKAGFPDLATRKKLAGDKGK